jgi:ABC-2 type transport system ATP-binding protein
MGMKQRLGIAVALLNDPELLLLDEPANGLDPAGIVALRDTLRTLASNGKTVFISSHILPEVEQLADIIGIIALGRIVSQGPLNELLEGQAVVRVRVQPDEVDRAMPILTALAGQDRVTIDDPNAAWLKASMATDRAAETNRALAAAGIYASGLTSGSDLESLFLELTTTESPETPTPTSGALPGWRGGAA